MTSPSYERINYALRPAKNIERKMIIEACSRLRVFFSLDAYRYIGMGSPYFSDFALFHRILGIEDMLCIEQQVTDADRFRFNTPFNCIEIEFRKTTEVLPTLDWENRPTIIWLDYDGPIDEEILADIDVVSGNISSGSIMLFTVRARAKDFGAAKGRLDEMKKRLPGKIPITASDSDVSTAKFPSFLWSIINNEIKHNVSTRNSGFRTAAEFRYSQVFNFRYADTVPMITVGGLVYQADQSANVSQCALSSLSFVMEGADHYEIEIPKLTIKELRALNEILPATAPSLPGLRDEDVIAYAKNYRYFPAFVEADL